jgi:hypothetical protein
VILEAFKERRYPMADLSNISEEAEYFKRMSEAHYKAIKPNTIYLDVEQQKLVEAMNHEKKRRIKLKKELSDLNKRIIAKRQYKYYKDLMSDLNKQKPKLPLHYLIMGLIVCSVILFFALAVCHAEEIIDDKAIKCITGEAENQGYQGQLAVAVAIRNRNTLKGVYGCNHKRKTPDYIYQQVKRAWEESKTNRIHTGTHWENIKAFGKPYWVDSMKLVYQYKDHNFYKAVNK